MPTQNAPTEASKQGHRLFRRHTIREYRSWLSCIRAYGKADAHRRRPPICGLPNGCFLPPICCRHIVTRLFLFHRGAVCMMKQHIPLRDSTRYGVDRNRNSCCQRCLLFGVVADRTVEMVHWGQSVGRYACSTFNMSVQEYKHLWIPLYIGRLYVLWVLVDEAVSIPFAFPAAALESHLRRSFPLTCLSSSTQFVFSLNECPSFLRPDIRDLTLRFFKR